MNYKIYQDSQYFIVDNDEWPELLVEMAQWLCETNACVEGITFFDQIEGEPYVAGTIHHSGTYTKKFDNPFYETPQEVIQTLKEWLDALS
jgi:hypothetical protein